jgi:hypothetical protein
VTQLPTWFFERRLDFLQLGPGSANVGAALLACGLVSGTFLLFFRSRLLRSVGWLWMFAGGLLLLATKSRGGILAALAGLLCTGLVAWRLRDQNRGQQGEGGGEGGGSRSEPANEPASGRNWRWILAGVVVFLVFAGYGLANRSLLRFGLGDSSRADLWPAGLAMLRDAPGGWGTGNAANVYAQWYQAPEDSRSYLSLINYHLTWLVEHGMAARIGYALAWAALFWVLCGAGAFSQAERAAATAGNTRSSVGLPLPSGGVLATGAGVWVAFFVAAIFSTTAKWWFLWIVPVIWLAAGLVWRWRRAIWPSWRSGVVFAGVALAVLAALHVAGFALRRHPLVLAGESRVIIGSGSPRIVFCQPEPGILGERWGQDVRRLVAEANVTAEVLFHDGLPDPVADLKSAVWVITGTLPDIPPEPSRVIFFNTVCAPEIESWLERTGPADVCVYISDSLAGPARFADWESLAGKRKGMRVEMIGGAALYVPGWPALVVNPEMPEAEQ